MNQGEQISLSDLGFSFSRMSQEFSLPMMERTSEPSSKRSSTLSTPTPMFLDLRKDRVGAEWGAFWETDGLSLGKYTTVSFGEFPKEGVDCALWQILEVNPLPKYSLSEKACQGILNRAEKRGKELPKPLKEALIQQITHSKCGNPNCNQGGMLVIENHPADSRCKVNDEGIVQTLNGRMGTGGGNVPMLLLTEDHFGDYNESDTAASLRKSGGTLGGART